MALFSQRIDRTNDGNDDDDDDDMVQLLIQNMFSVNFCAFIIKKIFYLQNTRVHTLLTIQLSYTTDSTITLPSGQYLHYLHYNTYST